MELDARLTLLGDPNSPAEARRFVARTLTPLLGREDVETAMLLTSELVTNATLHARTGCELALKGGQNTLRISVSDADSRQPPTGSAGREQASGRGLRVLETLCRRWGVEPGPGGKTVWCDLSVRG